MSKFKVGETYKTRDGKHEYQFVGPTSAGHLVFEHDEGKLSFTRLPDGRTLPQQECWGDLVLPKVIHKRALVWYSVDGEVRACLYESLELAQNSVFTLPLRVPWGRAYRLLKIEEITFEKEQT